MGLKPRSAGQHAEDLRCLAYMTRGYWQRFDGDALRIERQLAEDLAHFRRIYTEQVFRQVKNHGAP